MDAFGYGNATAGKSFGVSILSNGTLRLYIGGTNCDSAVGVIPLAQWSHVVVTQTASAQNMYVNGALVKSYTMTVNTQNGTTLYIGAGTLLTNRFSGYLDDIAFWSLVLDFAEVNTLYQKQKVFNP